MRFAETLYYNYYKTIVIERQFCIYGRIVQFRIVIYAFLLQTTDTCAVGGTSPYNFIKRNLYRLISNKLAQQYSWLGATTRWEPSRGVVRR